MAKSTATTPESAAADAVVQEGTPAGTEAGAGVEAVAQTGTRPDAAAPGEQIAGQGLPPAADDPAALLETLRAQGVDLAALAAAIGADPAARITVRPLPERPADTPATARPWHVLQPLLRDGKPYAPGPDACVWLTDTDAAPLVAAGVVERW